VTVFVVLDTLLTSITKTIRKTFEIIVDPLNNVIRRDLSAVVAKLHRIDFARSVDPGMGGSSSYIKELTEKLAFIKSEILSRYSLGNYGRTW